MKVSLAIKPYGSVFIRARDLRSSLLAIAAIALLTAAGCGASAAASASSAASRTSPATSASPASSVAITDLTGRILFARAGGIFGDETLFTAMADGSGARRVLPYGSSCCFRFSPDGSQILAAALAPDGNRITTMILDANGSHKRTIPLPDATLNLGPGAWSPNGARIAFEGWDETNPGRNGLYTARAADGGGLVRVTRAPNNQHDIPMDYSPDGSRILFLRPNRGAEDPIGPLFVVNTDGSGLHRITPNSVDAYYTARWSPDGSQIVFAGYVTVPGGAIWTVHPDGSHLTKLFSDSQGRTAITPTWSPDGTKIMFAMGTATGDPHPVNVLYVMTAQGRGLTPVIDTADFKRAPDWVAAR